jgi:hypothetical protein
MPAYAPHGDPVGALFGCMLFVLLFGAVLICIFPLGRLLVGGSILILALGSIAFATARQTKLDMARQRRLASERAGESICTFARSFNCRETDTWIIRAVFEELGEWVSFPPRADDSLENDLKIDDLFLVCIAEAVAQRTRRPLEGCEDNPFNEKVKSVRDLVSFFVHQEKSVV